MGKIEIDIITDLPKIVAWFQKQAQRDLKQVGIEASDDDIKRLFSEKQLRNIKIRSEYTEAKAAGIKITAIIFDLSKRYNISERNIRLIVYRKR